MNHQVSEQDHAFLRAFEACEVPPAAFDHEAHVRLAYIYLCEFDVAEATQRMRQSLLAFLAHLGVGEAKYHATLTQAWIMAVRHFMAATKEQVSAAAFVRANPRLLDARIMLTHYSAELLFSPQARQVFVDADIEPIPMHA